MNRGLEVPESTPIRALAVGTSTWVRTATAGIDEDGDDVTIRGPLDPATELEGASLDTVDCLLTDDRAVLERVDGACPVVYALESADGESIDRLRAEGATDVIAKAATDQPSLLAHRLRRTAESSAVQGVDRQETRFRALLEHTSDVVLVVDDDGTISSVGPSVEPVGGYSDEELLGSHYLERVHPSDAPSVRAAFDDLRSSDYGATTTVEYRCRHADNDWYVHETVLTNRLASGESRGDRLADEIDGIVASIRDVTSSHRIERELEESLERVSERERELRDRTEQLETIVQNVPVVLFELDADGTIALAEGRALERSEAVADDIVGESAFDVFDDHPGIRADVRAALEGVSTHSSIELDGRVFEQWCRPIVEDDTVDRVIGIAADVTERAQYQTALNALHEATSHLLTVESEQAVCEYVVDVASDVLDLETVVYRFDDQENELVPTAYSPVLESTIGSPPRLQPNGGLAWRAFVDDRPARFDDVRDAPQVSDPTTNARSGLYVPIGEHGVLVALDPEPGRYDEETFELAKLFARTAEAALDRITRTRQLHGHEWELKRQNEHLERLNAASQVRQDIEQLLLMADSRAEIERGICERLADLECCSFAWIGEPDPGGNQLLPRRRAGHGRGYLDAVSVTTVDDSAAEPAGRTARTRSPVFVENVADSIRDGAWRGEALSRSFQSIYTVPLVYDDFLYGVLTLYSDDRDAFDEPLRSMLAELGETIGYSIDAVKRKSPLDGESVPVVELELALQGSNPLGRLADRLDARVEFEGGTIRDDGAPTVFAVVDEPVSVDPADLTDLEGIGDVSVIADTDAETLLQLRYTGPFLGAAVDAHGGTLRTLVADDTGTRAIVEVPETVEVRNVLSQLNRREFAVELVARREGPTRTQSTIDAAARNALLEQLTDRQREVVQTAYHGGFFEWPRGTTGESIADSLGISSPAFQKHVRATERKLFTALFDGRPLDG